MESDFFFRMGSTHAVCQDYAVAGESGDLTYAMLADGCSGKHIPGEPGSPYTDFGARFLVQCTRRYLGELMAQQFPATAIAHDAGAIIHQARLPGVALDATLLVAVAKGDKVVACQTGDGVIAFKTRDGTLCYESIEFGNGMPYYLSYLLSPTRKNFLLHPPPDSGAKPEDAGKITITDGRRLPGGQWERHQTVVTFDERSPVERQMMFEREQVEIVLLFSDGVSSFQLKDGTQIPLEKVLDQIFDIKGFKGQFLTRRCARFLQKFCSENGWQHSDDFSVAGIHLGASP